MSEAGPRLSNDDFAGLTFGDKLSLSKALCHSYGLTVLALMVGGGLVLGFVVMACFSWLGFNPELLIGISAGSVETESIAGQLLGLFLLIMLAGLFMQFLMIGINALVLLYIDNQEPSSALAVFLSPWARFGPVFLCLLLWLGISFLIQVVLGIFGRIPGLGFLLELAVSLAYSIVSNCAMFYIADKILGQNEELPPPEAVARPLAIVLNNPWAWLSVFGFMILIYLPFIAIGAMGLMNGPMILALAGGIGLMAASVFVVFLFGVTYKQTSAQYDQRAKTALPF